MKDTQRHTSYYVMMDWLKTPRDRQVCVQKTPEAPMISKSMVERPERKRRKQCCTLKRGRSRERRVVRISRM